MAETKVDQQLKDDKITIGDFPKEPKKDSFITAKIRNLKKKICSSLKNQTVTLEI